MKKMHVYIRSGNSFLKGAGQIYLEDGNQIVLKTQSGLVLKDKVDHNKYYPVFCFKGYPIGDDIDIRYLEPEGEHFKVWLSRDEILKQLSPESEEITFNFHNGEEVFSETVKVVR